MVTRMNGGQAMQAMAMNAATRVALPNGPEAQPRQPIAAADFNDPGRPDL
jgi:hypothetical protein